MAAVLESLPNVLLFVSKKIEELKTHKQISDELRQLYPNVRGLSARSVRRFCDTHEIYRSSKLSNKDLDRAVLTSIGKVMCLLGQ